ncbi:MAG: glucose-1-phosphate thymidylyltransferase RfbA [Flavobacteriaceae bacterium]|jgi:glucose-1-phosphate thymidylyltransferase|nr:glucose-1-phosphate thymidylyltransferase RfbA [Flavobacteriaceae bacterium]
MKGIVLAGGFGSRLNPVTRGVSKQLLPVYDKPMVYYPISVLMTAGINQILLISTPMDLPAYKRLLGDGSFFGVDLKYAEQKEPNGLAEAFIIGENFIGKDGVCMILGDNIFYGKGLEILMQQAIEAYDEATVFGYKVKDPKRYGVIEFNNEGKVISIKEKPKKPKSDKALVGLYFYPNEVIEIAKSITPSPRGELEISSINQIFLEQGILKAKILERGFAWLDTGTHESLIEAGQFVHTLEKRQGIKIACLEEIAFKKGWISHKKLILSANALSHTEYGQYLLNRYKTK